jgi:hypothetical protein
MANKPLATAKTRSLISAKAALYYLFSPLTEVNGHEKEAISFLNSFSIPLNKFDG